jgi:hypothetical protein
MKVEILSTAEDDLVDGHRFYEGQLPGIGNYFLDTLFSEIDSLQLYGGTHGQKWGKFRMLSKRFPFGIFYTIKGDMVHVCAVMDLRRRPSFLRRQLRREH